MKYRRNFTLDSDIIVWLSSKDNQSQFVNDMCRSIMDAEEIDIEMLNQEKLKIELEEIKQTISNNQKILNQKNIQLLKIEEINKQKQKDLILKKIQTAEKEKEKHRCLGCGNIITTNKFLPYTNGKICLNCEYVTRKSDRKNWGELIK